VRKAIGDTGPGPRMIETAYGEGFRFAAPVERVIGDAPPSPPGVPIWSGRPAIAVLPFENLSDDPEQAYFAEGIGDDLRTRLTTWRVFAVIAGSSSDAYRNSVDAKLAGVELGARYVVEGRVQKERDEVRVNAQLTDAADGRLIWSERYTGKLDSVFRLQDEISELIAGAMTGEALRAASAEAARREPRSVDAWDLVLRGVWHLRTESVEGNARSRELFEKALELDSDFAFAAARLGLTFYLDLFHQWTGDWIRTLGKLEWAADTCLRLDRREPEGHLLKGLHHMVLGRREEAIALMRIALDLNPSYASIHSLMGQLLAMGGRPDQGRAHVETAIRLSPRDARTDLFYVAHALVDYCSDDFEAAIGWARRALRLNPDFAINHACIAASHAHLGELEEAQEAVEILRRRWPAFSVSMFERLLSSAAPEYRDSFRRGLELAGLAT
jgi:TolB-like protein